MPDQVPPPDTNYLDHTGHFIADADTARAELEGLGFTVTPFSAQRQPDPKTGRPELTGTGNICVMLPEGYLEFLVHTADTPLGREFTTALERRAGLHLMAFGAADAAERHAALEAGGHAMRPLVHFSRDVDAEGGSITAAFTVARLAAGAMPEGRVQVCTHHAPAALWQPRWTAHPNGARRLLSMVISSPMPEETAGRFARFLGAEARPAGEGLRISLDRGSVDILPEPQAADLIGQSVAPGESAFAAVRISVLDLDRMADRVLAEGRGARLSGKTLVVPFGPALGRGAFLFEQD